MLNLDRIMDIKQLKKEGYSIKGIVRETGFSRNTVRAALREKYKDKRVRRERKSILDPYKDYVRDRYERTELTGQHIYHEIIRLGYNGSIYQIYRFLRPFKKAAIEREKLTVRFETLPGKQSQVDWGYCGGFTDVDGAEKKLYAFVMILSYSRAVYVEFTTSMKREWLLRCHINAFEYFGGVSETILYDNMSQIITGNGGWNKEFMDFTGHYGFIPKRCRPYRARTKGKVERAIKYLKGNFLPERVFASLDDANVQGRHWMEYTANCRIHGTTGKRPCDLLKDENLYPVGKMTPYHFVSRKERRANYDGFVFYDRSRYSIPADTAGKEVIVEQDGHSVRILCDDMLVAEHRKADRPGMSVAKKEHLAQMWKLTLGDKPLPQRTWDFASDNDVESRSLTVYEEASR